MPYLVILCLVPMVGQQIIYRLLTWCQRAGIRHVTVFLCSTENIANRGDAEVAFLMDVIEQVVARQLSRDPAWQVRIAGDLDALPDTTARAPRSRGGEPRLRPAQLRRQAAPLRRLSVDTPPGY